MLEHYRMLALLYLAIRADNAASADRFSDDVYAFALNAVSLTATAAVEADSLEGAGIRIDGRDGGLQTTYNGNPLSDYMTATFGHARFDITQRHAAATSAIFDEGAGAWWGMIFVDVNNWVDVYWSAANTVTLRVRDGGVENTSNWAAAGLIDPATAYTAEIKYTATEAEFIVDGTVQATVVVAIDLGGPPVTIYYGSDNSEANQVDAVFSPPTP